LNVTETVEAEAMPAHFMRELLQNKIESFVPERAIRAAKVAEQSERDFLNRLVAIVAADGA